MANDGQPVRLYVNGAILGYQRGLRTQNNSTSLIKIKGVDSKEDVEFYLGKKVAFITKSSVDGGKAGSKYRCKDTVYKVFEDKYDRETGRQRWLSRNTFILAMVGYCVGLGNFWRFPYLCYTYGGALFFVPYFSCLLFIGIPVTLMEMTLGQKF